MPSYTDVLACEGPGHAANPPKKDRCILPSILAEHRHHSGRVVTMKPTPRPTKGTVKMTRPRDEDEGRDNEQTRARGPKPRVH
jgi:hypothetical protein